MTCSLALFTCSLIQAPNVKVLEKQLPFKILVPRKLFDFELIFAAKVRVKNPRYKVDGFRDTQGSRLVYVSPRGMVLELKQSRVLEGISDHLTAYYLSDAVGGEQVSSIVGRDKYSHKINEIGPETSVDVEHYRLGSTVIVTRMNWESKAFSRYLVRKYGLHAINFGG